MAERSRPGPLVVACLAPADLHPSVDPLTGAVRCDPRRATLTSSDAAALEHALRAAEAWGGRVLALAAGGGEVKGALRTALALGASVLRVEGAAVDDLAGDPSSVAAALAGAILDEGDPALVVCGDRSAAVGVGAVPVFLAHLLGAAQALGLVALEPSFDDLSLTATRRLDRGWKEVLRVRAPAVCSVEAAGVRLRRAPLSAAVAASRAPVPVAGGRVPAGVVGGPLRVGAPLPYRPRTKVVAPPAGGPHQRVVALTGALESRDPPRLFGPCSAAVAADELLTFLRRYGYLREGQGD